MGKRVKSVSMPGLAAKLDEQGDINRGRRYIWHVRRIVDYVRSGVSNRVEIIATRDAWNPAGWEGVVAKGSLNDDGLLDGYTIENGVPYPIGRALDKAWESLQ